jgi:hypothetical protein
MIKRSVDVLYREKQLIERLAMEISARLENCISHKQAGATP